MDYDGVTNIQHPLIIDRASHTVFSSVSSDAEGGGVGDASFYGKSVFTRKWNKNVITFIA